MASLFFERISSSSSSSSYSFSTHRRKYDVFLSFCVETRNGFTDHLFEELRRKRIHVFRGDEKLQGGEVVALELIKAIEESQYAIVVLSEKFADSKRCLDELAKIVECREKTGLSIFPVFDHVDPSDVHNQKGPFETVFAKHETDDSVTIEKKQKWMDALRDVSNISGWCLHDRSESTVIQNIVERMHSELYGEFESVSKDLVGMESSIEGVIDLLDKGSDDVRFIGIWGCGGVGKTTLAQVIYCKISNQFDTKSFICFDSVGQTKNDYLVPIQKLLLSNFYAKRELNITSVHEEKKVIKQMLCSRKVLIVLDNVNNKSQLDAIAESRDWFGAGSRLIITSRDEQLLTSYNVDMYEAKTLDNDKALELFSWKAFKQPHPKKDFVDLSNDFVKYAQGLPLLLEVFGSSLQKEGIEVWKIFLDQLNENSSGKIMERLEICYKRILDQKVKELFLDIAFFFKGMDKNRVANILNDPSYWENIDILKKKSLITILGRKIWMHDLLQEMGREIVQREAPQEPGIRSRLWRHEDIFSILKNNTGTKRVEGMMLNCPPNKEDLNANCFSEMTRLRLINICNVLLPHGLNYLSNELQMMEWNDYPLKFMPRNFRPNNLVELIMHHSHIEQLPEEFTNLDQLKLMDLSYSQNLIKTPDFIQFRNLERVIFQGCTRLYHVQPSVVALRWLTLLNLKDCKHLKSLPYEIDLESLEIFILSGCARLKKFSEVGRNMTRLSELYLDGTAIKVLPPSIKHLTGLTLLNLKDCNDLLNFPSVICSLTSLEILTLSGCRGQPRKPLHLLGLSPMASSIGVNLTFKGTILLLIMSFLVLPYNYLSIFVCATLIIWTYCFLNARYPEPEPINLLLPKSFSGLSSLKSLDLSDCNLSDGALPEDLSCLSSLRFLNLGKNNFTFLPDSISQLSKLKLLCLDDCSNLQSLPYLPSSTNFVMARGCTSLENYSKKVVVWTSGETGFTFINCLSLVEEEDKITEVSLLGSLLEDEGSKRTEVSLLDIHFQPLWQRYMEDQIRESEGFCCVLPQSDITEWFKNQNCGSYVSIPLHRYNISLRGIALCVDFEVRKNSNEVSPGQDAKFICRLYMDGAPKDPIVYTVPRDKICGGSFGIWLYISHKTIREVDQCDCIRPLIRTNSAHIEIKRCGARILYESDVVEFVQHLSQNIFGSPAGLRRPSEDIKKCHSGNSQSPDDRVESSQSNALIEPSTRLRSALWSLLSRLYEGDHARHHYYDYIFPQIAIPRDWFSYQNLESYIKMEFPPHLHDNSTWMGFTIFASYTDDKQRAGWSYEQNSTIFLHLHSFSASDEVPLAPYIAFPLSGDDFDESSRRLLVFYIPRARFQLNCFSHIWASFRSNNQVVKVEMCGIRIVYEQDVEQFVQTLVQRMLEIPVAYRPSLNQNLLHQLALLQDCNHERGFYSSFLSERRPQTMPRLLPTNEIVAEEDCTSPKNQVIATSSRNSSPFKGTEVVKGIVLNYQGYEVVEGMVLNSPLHKENLNDKAFYHVNPFDVGNQRESFEKAFLKQEEDREVRKEQIKEWRTALKEVSKIHGRHLLDRSATPSSSLSASSSSIPGSDYDVFLSFRGEDTCHGFTEHLYEAFRLEGIEAFRDSKKLQLGQEIASELIQAIENSQYAIVVFSKKYADSRWCLDELVKIVECKKNKGLEVVPVFYHVDPSDVRKQTGPFEKAFDEHQRHDRIDGKKIQKWKDAMREVGNLAGEHLIPHQRSEAKCIKLIVKEILNKLSNTFSADTVGLVGIKTRVEKLKSHLAMKESNDVRIIGIWGTGGMGKTTLAKVVYDMVSNEFEACCFIDNVREESGKCGLHKIQQILLRELLNDRDLKVHNDHNGDLMIKSRLRKKKILLVLDDVNESKQLKKLAGEHCWFGLGSRVIITTRDKHLLESHEANEIYEAEVLNHEEALQLFSLKALKMDHPPEDYGKLSQAFVDYSMGLPLALEVLGSLLFNKSIGEWKSELGRLTKFCDREILNVLRISYDGLQATEKDIFLNIACFFNHKNGDDVIKFLDNLELDAEIGLRVLIDKSLIKWHENQLWMHDLLQEMGRDIVCQECKDPEERSRLWSFEDINNVLTENTGTKQIQCIVLEMHEPKIVDWNPEAFSKMRNLKLLKICGVQLMHDIKHLPNSLRVLDWRGCPLKSLTSSSQSKSFENLKFIELSESPKLIEVPGIIEVPNLKSLVLEDCINLRRIHPSIGIHKKITILNLQGCKNLTSLPSKFEMECLTILNLEGCKNLTSLPSKFEMECLTELYLCGCSKIKKIPEFSRNMKRVLYLFLGDTAITTLPTSIEHLTDLFLLDSRNCKNLVHLPDTIFNLKLISTVNLKGCSKLDRLPENLGNAESLLWLDLSETAIRKVPSSIGLLKHLDKLRFRGCKGLSSNKSWYEHLPFHSTPTSPHPVDLLFSSLSLSPASSLSTLLLEDCNLKAISNDIGSLFNLYELDLSGNDFVCLPESIIKLSKLEWMYLNNCTSLRSLPKLPSNVRGVEAEGCISLEMLPDPLKPSNSLEPSLDLRHCFQLADNQSCVDWFISGIKKSLKLSPSLPFSVLKTNPYCPYDIVIPGSEIPEWFSHQSIRKEVKIKQPSHLCKKVGIAICIVFCTERPKFSSYLSLSLIANGKRIYISYCPSIDKVSSDHVSLVYVVPEFFDEEPNKLLWEGDVNGFSQIRIKIASSFVKVKKWGLRMIYKEDIEDLDQTMVQNSNSNITPYDGMDILHHNFSNSSMAVECHKVKCSRDDYNGAGPSGEGSSKRIKRHTETNGDSDSEEPSEYKDCDEELSDCEESNEHNPDG